MVSPWFPKALPVLLADKISQIRQGLDPNSCFQYIFWTSRLRPDRLTRVVGHSIDCCCCCCTIPSPNGGLALAFCQHAQHDQVVVLKVDKKRRREPHTLKNLAFPHPLWSYTIGFLPYYFDRAFQQKICQILEISIEVCHYFFCSKVFETLQPIPWPTKRCSKLGLLHALVMTMLPSDDLTK